MVPNLVLGAKTSADDGEIGVADLSITDVDAAVCPGSGSPLHSSHFLERLDQLTDESFSSERSLREQDVTWLQPVDELFEFPMNRSATSYIQGSDESDLLKLIEKRSFLYVEIITHAGCFFLDLRYEMIPIGMVAAAAGMA